MLKRQVIHHSADMDGLFSAAIFLQDDRASEGARQTRFTPWDFGQPVPEIDSAVDQIIVIDLPFDVHPDLVNDPRLVWIDHHKTAIDRCPDHIKKYVIDGVAACRLGYQWIKGTYAYDQGILMDIPTKEDYVERRVCEPTILTLVGEHDVWDHHDPRAMLLQYGLYDTMGQRSWEDTLTPLLEDNEGLLNHLVGIGQTIDRWFQSMATSVAKERGYCTKIQGIRFFTLASCHARSSKWFGTDIPKWAEALLCWRYDGDMIKVSMYHAPGHEHHDLSYLAKCFGGGGHKGACGFEISAEDTAMWFQILLVGVDPGVM